MCRDCTGHLVLIELLARKKEPGNRAETEQVIEWEKTVVGANASGGRMSDGIHQQPFFPPWHFKLP